MPELQGIFQSIYDPATQSIRVSGSGDAVWLNHNDFTVQAGTPAVDNTDVPGWLFDAAADEAIHTTFMLPTFFPWLSVDFVWANAAAGAGNVRWVADLKTLSPGDLISEAVVTTGVTTAAGAQNAVMFSNDVISTLGVVGTNMYGLRVRRDADDAADTLANDVKLLGVRLRRPI